MKGCSLCWVWLTKGKNLGMVRGTVEKLKISRQLGVTDFEDLCYYPGGSLLEKF